MDNLDWIPVTRPNGDARRLPLSRASLYRLAKDGLLAIKKIDGRMAVLQREIDGILSLLRKESRDD